MRHLAGCICFILTIGFMLASPGTGSVRLPVPGRVASRPARAIGLTSNPQGSAAPIITSVQLFYLGLPVSELVIGTKAKRYSLKITGAAFDPSARVIVDGMKARVTSATSTELVVNLKGGTLMFPGEVAVRVVNANGQTSNDVIIEVVTDPAILSIASISPDFGPLGTQVTITGLGFAAKGNHIRLLSRGTDRVGVTADVDSPDGKTLAFSLPDFICPPCSLSVPPCDAPCFVLSAGVYDVFVINGSGMSNGLSLLVSSPTGPIGLWGEQGLSVEVTDTHVMIAAPCFAGEIPQTLTTDAMGNFKLAGTITLLVGPVDLTRPAIYQGSVNGSTMTLTITSESLTRGPFILAFGVEVHVEHT